MTPRHRYDLQDPELDRAIDELMEQACRRYSDFDDSEYVRQIVVSAVRMMRDGTSTPDLKLINSALKELRHSFRVFAPYKHIRKVAAFGSARTEPDHPDWRQAYEFAERIAAEGWMVITGAGDGIMGALQGGAGRARSFGVNIRLPFEQRANEVIARDPKLINFRYFFTRKVTFVKEAHAIALFPGGFGTHDEGLETLTLIQTGKSEIVPVVFIDSPGGSYWSEWNRYFDKHLRARGLISKEDQALFRITDDVETAADEILSFYSNYHSSRYVRDLLVLRVRHAPEPADLDALNTEFADLLSNGRIEVSKPLPEEAGEASQHPRIVLRFNRRDVGRLRMLIDSLNSLIDERTSPAVEASPREIVEEPLPPEAENAEQNHD
jgi:uncharacterized protein (TIGR00730 family)